MSEIPKINSSLSANLKTMAPLSTVGPVSNEYYQKATMINAINGNQTNLEMVDFYETPLSNPRNKALQSILQTNLTDFEKKVANYKNTRQQELKDYNTMLIPIQKEIQTLEENLSRINELKNNYEVYKQDGEGRIYAIVTNYQTYCSEEKLKELGITNDKLQNMSYIELETLCKTKDSSIKKIVQDIEQYKVNYLDKEIEKLTGFATYEDYNKKMNSLKSDQAILLSAIRATKEDISCAKYRFLLSEEDYQNYSYTETDVDKLSPLEKVRNAKSQNLSLVYENYDTLQNIIQASKSNPDLSKMYNYLYETEGLESANLYLKNMESTINKTCGMQNAEKFLNKLKEEENVVDTLTNHLKTTKKGLIGGVDSFAQGISSWFTTSDVYTIHDYETMYILQELQTNENYNDLLDNNYEISQSIGQMLPSIALSMILTPAVGTTSMGISAGGNSYHSALAEGQSTEKAVIYGVINGVSEATLERYLGSIPGLSDVSVTGLKTFAQAIMKEGIEEGTQEYLDALVRNGLFDEAFDMEQISKNASKSAIYGAITGGIMNTPSLAVSGVNKMMNGNIDSSNITQINAENVEKFDNNISNIETAEVVNNVNIESKENESVEDNRIANTKNRVFDGERAMPLGRDNPISLPTNSNFVYRVTGMSQVVDIINCGYARAKKGKVKGGHRGELFWTSGSDRLFYYDKRPVLEVPADKISEGQIGALSINDLSAIWIFNETSNQYENRINDLKTIFQSKIENAQITEEAINNILMENANPSQYSGNIEVLNPNSANLKQEGFSEEFKNNFLDKLLFSSNPEFSQLGDNTQAVERLYTTLNEVYKNGDEISKNIVSSFLDTKEVIQIFSSDTTTAYMNAFGALQLQSNIDNNVLLHEIGHYYYHQLLDKVPTNFENIMANAKKHALQLQNVDFEFNGKKFANAKYLNLLEEICSTENKENQDLGTISDILSGVHFGAPLTGPNGPLILPFMHNSQYYMKRDMEVKLENIDYAKVFDEQFANFFSLYMNNQTEKIEVLRLFLGEEWYQTMLNTLTEINDICIEKSDSPILNNETIETLNRKAENTELWNGETAPITDEFKTIYNKLKNGEALTFEEKLSFGRDNVYRKIDGYELKPDCVYRVVNEYEYKQYLEKGYISTREGDEYILGENNGGVDWYLGGAALKYPTKKALRKGTQYIIECPADKNYFQFFGYNYGIGMSNDIEVRFMKSSGFENAIPLSMITKVIERPFQANNVINGSEIHNADLIDNKIENVNSNDKIIKNVEVLDIEESVGNLELSKKF